MTPTPSPHGNARRETLAEQGHMREAYAFVVWLEFESIDPSIFDDFTAKALLWTMSGGAAFGFLLWLGKVWSS